MIPTDPIPKTSVYTNRTIGLLADWFDEHYQQVILRTVEEGVTQRGSSLVSFAGGIPGSSTRDSAQRQHAFELVSPTSVDGAVLLAGTMVNELGPEALNGLLGRLKGLPLCSIGVELPGIPSILVDNQTGVEHAIHHLVEKHAVRRIGFIRGPSKNKEAESRFAAYRAALQHLRLEYDEDLVLQGDFLRVTGESAVDTWLSNGKLPEAIICANDEMALGALAALSRAGKNVPGDVKLVGFDDLEAARHTNPPLTTVRQPLKDLGIAAVRTIMDQVLGREVSRVQVLETQLVVRESCGCRVRLSSTGQSMVPEPLAETAASFEQEFAHRRQALRVELARAARGEFLGVTNWEDRLIANFVDLMTLRAAEFVPELSKLLTKISNSGGDISRFQDVISAFRRVAVPCCGTDQPLRAKAEDTLQECRLLISQAIERAEASKRLSLERFTRTLVDVGTTLTSSYNINDLQIAVQTELPRLGITACYLAVYHPFSLDGANPTVEARLVAGYQSGTPLALTDGVFASHSLAPSDLWPPARTSRFLVLPLFLKGRNLGFVMLESTTQGSVIEMVRGQLSVALYGSLLARK